jgi:hypothetical protein
MGDVITPHAQRDDDGGGDNNNNNNNIYLTAIGLSPGGSGCF